MKPVNRAVVALLALLTLLPAASAAAPTRDAAVQVVATPMDVAVADDGSFAAAVFPAAPAGGAPSDLDVVALNLSNSSIEWSNRIQPSAPGKEGVTISRDGSVVVTRSLTPATETSSTSYRNLNYYRTEADLTAPAPIPPGQTPFMSPQWSRRIAAPVVGAELSADGRVLAVATGGDPPAVSFHGPAGQEIVSVRPSGAVAALAITDDGAYAVAGGAKPLAEGEGEVGFVELVRQGGQISSFTLDGMTGVTAIATSRSGSDVLVGTADGRFVRFRPQGGVLGSTVDNRGLELGPIRHIVVSADGATAVFGADRGFGVLRLGPDAAPLVYSSPLTTSPSALDVTADGSYMLVVANDAYGYLTARNQQLWTIAGPFQGGGMDDNARALVLVRGAVLETYDFARSLFFRHAGASGPTDTAPAAQLGADGAARFATVVISNGSAFDRVRVELPTDPGVQLSANRTEFDIAPGGSVPVEIVATPASLPPGTYTYNATARSLLGGGVANLSFSFVVPPRAGFTMTLQGVAERVVQRGETNEAVFVVRNNGNVRIDATLRVTQSTSQGAPWDVQMVPAQSISVPGGATSSVVLRVTPPAASANGTTDRVVLSATSPQGNAQGVVAYTLSPNLGVKVDTPSRVKFVGPTQSAWFNLTAQNTGSVRTAYELAYEVVSQTGAGWNVDADLAPFDLGTGATRTLPVRVFAPGTGTATDRITLFVSVRSLERIPGRLQTPLAEDNLTLIANLNPDLAPRPPDFVPEDGVYQLPAPTAILVVAAAALAVGISRRARA